MILRSQAVPARTSSDPLKEALPEAAKLHPIFRSECRSHLPLGSTRPGPATLGNLEKLRMRVRSLGELTARMIPKLGLAPSAGATHVTLNEIDPAAPSTTSARSQSVGGDPKLVEAHDRSAVTAAATNTTGWIATLTATATATWL